MIFGRKNDFVVTLNYTIILVHKVVNLYDQTKLFNFKFLNNLILNNV